MNEKYFSILEKQINLLKQKINKIEQSIILCKELSNNIMYEVMFCPACNKQHIDEGEFAIKLHHTHRCVNDFAGMGCGCEWREKTYKFGINLPIPSKGI